MGNWDLGFLPLALLLTSPFTLLCLQFIHTLSSSLRALPFLVVFFLHVICCSPFGFWMLLLVNWLVFFCNLQIFVGFYYFIGKKEEILFKLQALPL